ncbi:MAG: enoyl-CoA hydratase/isomerase family protein [Lewinella sp.]|nr:enoyl-CoA hydratase/isomerase family protein [Lewinella sp.]
MIHFKKDTDNIATLIFDMRGRRHNVINHRIAEAFEPIMRHLQQEKARGSLRGVIITSAKKSFLSGGDFDYLYRAEDAAELLEIAEKLARFHRDLERPGVPVVAAINGDALGAGFQVALACHHRVVLDDPKIRVGLPEVNYGLMPSGGSIIRLMWLLGMEQAFPILIQGKRYSPQEALQADIIDELASSPKEMMEKAKRWLLANREGRRPWDQLNGAIPFGTARRPATAERVRALAAQLSADTHNNYPAKTAILNLLVEGSKVDFDTAVHLENRHFANLVRSRRAKNMISTYWFDYQSIRQGLGRPRGYGRFRPRKVGIIGAGLMGSGIAFACLRNGLSVVLKDVSKLIAERGRDYVQQKLATLIQDGTFQPSEREEILGRIVTTDDPADFSDCDLVIEAVFENQQVKQKVTREAEEYMDEYSLMATNTISISITKLAQATLRPENYVGLHFFHPADEVPLVEIVRGDATSEETIARAFDFVTAIKKIPILVKDDWGFYAARVQNTYILEGIALLQDGYPPALIENLGNQLGMPKGPLELADDLGLELVLRYERLAAAHYGAQYIQHPAVSVLEAMLQLDPPRSGRAKLAGFYEYGEGDHRQLWSGLADHWPISQTDYDRREITERLLFAQVIEAVWCLQEGVLASAEAANLGSVYGWGFPGYTGGVIRYVEDYGLDAFLAQCKVYQKAYGQRFRAPRQLQKIVEDRAIGNIRAAVE